jgi:uncharacterized SAM-binding protein YcdF (DUF218 family)
MRFILLILGLLFSADGLYCAATAHMGWGELVVTFIGVIFILWSVFYEAAREKKILKILKGVFVVFMVVYAVYSAMTCIYGQINNATYDEDYVIVLGAGLNGDEPSATLKNRLDKTIEYVNKNDNATVIVSGGRGKGERISEASAMKTYLINNGVSEDKIRYDENSTSTNENFAYSKLVIDSDKVAFITSDFHVMRASHMAKINGIDATHVGASTPILTVPTACAREMLAQVYSLFFVK